MGLKHEINNIRTVCMHCFSKMWLSILSISLSLVLMKAVRWMTKVNSIAIVDTFHDRHA